MSRLYADHRRSLAHLTALVGAVAHPRPRRTIAFSIVPMLAAFLFATGPALAQNYTGGNGADGHAGAAGAAGGGGGNNGYGAGTAPSGGNGGVGAGSNGGGPFGGSGGTYGGMGGGPDSGGAGGAGYETSGGGGGGAGGAGAAPSSTLDNSAGSTIIIGGNGGHGGAGNSADSQYSSGGGGGGGGSGVVISGANLTNEGAIHGGDGGEGGAGAGSQSIPSLNDGSGGYGGFGVKITNGTLTNSGTITGGNGGYDGSGTFQATGGSGVYGQNATIINSGTIAGGNGNNAITFLNGTNTLELREGYAFGGNVEAPQGTNTLALGGSANASFDVSQIGGTGSQFYGFNVFDKRGTSTWTLTGTTGAVTPWTISAGTLAVSSDGNLGAPAGTLTINGGVLENTASFTTDRAMTLGVLTPQKWAKWAISRARRLTLIDHRKGRSVSW